MKNLLLLILFLWCSCSYQHENGQSVAGNNSNSDGFSLSETITFSLLKRSSLKTCQQCHKSGSQRIALENISDYQYNLSLVLSKMMNRTMPPSSLHVLSQCELDIVQTWINLNAPDDSGIKLSDVLSCTSDTSLTQPVTPEIPLLEKPLNYQTVKVEIFAKKCMICHSVDSSNTDAQDFLFYPYSEVVKNSRWYKTPSATSKIIRIVTSQSGSDPQRPESGSGVEILNSEEVQFLKNWIDAGIPEF